ncbi:MAG TPA: tetratricopeptide repeat protein [Blastocatellia bacterium]|nr:tetratricopeptide repeat protein [Blastocatellia bacterium]
MAQSRKQKRKPTTVAEKSASLDSTKATSARQARREKARDKSQAKKLERWVIAGLLAVTLLVFANSLQGEFVYDDRMQILNNPTITSLSNIPRMFTESVWQFLNEKNPEAVGPYYRPLFNVALIVGYQLFEYQTFGWHLISILFHLAAVMLIYALARRWDMRTDTAAAAALLFGVHPVHSESVAWVAALPDPMATVFILSSLLLYERYYHSERRAGPLTLVLSVAFAFMALLSKEVAVIYPIFLAVRELLDRPAQESLVATVTRLLKRTAPFLLIVPIYLAMRYAVLGFITKTEPNAVGIPASHVLLTIPSILLSYVRLLVIPYPLSVMYDNTYVTSPGDIRYWGAVLVLTLLAGAVLWMVRSSAVGRRALAFLILFLLPVLNLKAFRPEESLLHDRYLYLPSIGFCLLVALALERVVARFASDNVKVFRVATILLSVVLLVITVSQNRTWQNEIALTNHALEVTPRWPYLHNYIGANHSLQNRFAEAERAYNEALTINPGYYDSHSNLGDVYQQQGKLVEAEQAYRKAIEYGAPYSNTYYNLGVVLTGQRKLEAAEQPLIKAVEIQPSNTKARYNLAWVYDNQGKTQLAEQAYLETLRYNSSYPEPRINLGVLLTKQGRFAEAAEQLETAARYAPDHPVMLYALGDVYLRTNRYQDAITAFNKVVARTPNHQFAHTSLGLCYERLGNKERAKAHYQKAIEVAPQEAYTNTAREGLARL